MNSKPPLPDYLDVPAAEIVDEHLHRAAELVGDFHWIMSDGSLCPKTAWYAAISMPTLPMNEEGRVNPHACIARWAGEDAERWRALALELMWPDEPWMEMPVGIFDSEGAKVDQKSAIAMLFIVSNATPTQLYRALVNAGWNEWRDKYNEQRKAAEVTE